MQSAASSPVPFSSSTPSQLNATACPTCGSRDHTRPGLVVTGPFEQRALCNDAFHTSVALEAAA